MAQVGIVMGSDSDMPVMAKAADILEELGISYEMTIISAHREPDIFFDYAKSAEDKGFKVIIAGAGIVGEHEVIFASGFETITLSHLATDRSVFADGAVKAAIYLADKKSGLYNMNDVINGK